MRGAGERLSERLARTLEPDGSEREPEAQRQHESYCAKHYVKRHTTRYPEKASGDQECEESRYSSSNGSNPIDFVSGAYILLLGGGISVVAPNSAA